jgi:DNA-binding CsgD family transcriptional regulator
MEMIGRDPELRGIERWLTSPDGVLLIAGEPGIGKSTLWRAGVDEAARRGYRVLECTAAGSEAQLAFTTLRDLLSDVFDEVADALAAPQRHALDVVLLREESGPSPPDPGTIAVAFLGTLTTLAARGPTLLAIDDVQWIDDASAAPVSYALRRLDTPGLAALLARRVGSDSAQLADLPEARIRAVTLGSLSIGALGHILRVRLGTSYSRATLHRLYEASGGNPFFALEIGAALEEHGEPLDFSAPLPIPATLEELLRRRIQGVSPRARDALLVAAAMAMPETDVVERVGSASGVAEAIASGIVVADGSRLRFTHPLLAEAVSAQADVRQRRDVHRRLAVVVSDTQQRALHLALAADGPDATIADALDRAAAVARSRGAPREAAHLSQEAARVTMPADEDASARRTIAAALWWTDAGDTWRSLALIDPLLRELPRGSRRLDALYAKARAVEDRVHRELLEEAVSEADGHPAQHVRLLFLLCYALLHGLEFDAARERAEAAVEIAEQSQDSGSLVLALSMSGRLSRGRGALVALRRARRLKHDSSTVDAYESPATWLGWWLLANDELDAARRILLGQHRIAVETGDGWNRTFLHWPLTEVECRAGNYDAAREYAETGLELAGQSENRYAVSALRYCRALVAAHLGDSATATADAEESLAEAEALHSDLFTVRPRVALAFVSVSEGRYDVALDHLEGLTELALHGPYWAAYPFWGDLVEALVSVGDLDGARSLLVDLDGRGLAAERPGTAPVLVRCRGLVLAASGSLEESVAELEEASRLERDRSVPLEHARTLLALGEAQRRARRRRAARETLQEAHATFEALGAARWVERATTELARIGGRAPATSLLTPAEERVAALVAEGKSNKEVASALTVSVHTVESALASIYRKLDVHSRTEMARRLASESKDQ